MRPILVTSTELGEQIVELLVSGNMYIVRVLRDRVLIETQYSSPELARIMYDVRYTEMLHKQVIGERNEYEYSSN